MFFLGGTATEPVIDTPHFTVKSLSSPVCFSGESLVVDAVVINDEPEREVAVPTTTEIAVTPAADDSDSEVEVTAVPTIIVEIVRMAGANDVIAELRGDGVDIVRTINLSLANEQSKTVHFDFGQVPVGSYTVTVTARSYNNSTVGKSVSVYDAPTLSDWTITGDAAFLMANLRYDSVDVKIRNDGQRTVIFSGSQYGIYANTTGYGVPLPGLNATMVQPGENVTVHATIPAAGRYYLDHFAIRVPGRASLVIIPVRTWMEPAI
jgi:hypothetical protein